MMSEEKVCTLCKQSKLATAEHFYLKGKYLVGRCKTCVVAASKARYLANPDKVRACVKAYREANPDKVRATFKAWYLANQEKQRAYYKAQYLANPEKKIAASKAWQLANADKMRAFRKAWELANPEKSQAAKKAYQENNPEKIRAKSKAWRLANPEKKRAEKAKRRAHTRNATGSHTVADISRLYAEQAGQCWYCAVALASNYHVDHSIPLSRGGGNGPGNLRLACPSCNLRKSTMLPSEFAYAIQRSQG